MSTFKSTMIVFFKSILIVFFVVLLIIAYLINQIRVQARHHLLCEVLKPGMSANQVLDILRKTGEFAWEDTRSVGANKDFFEIYVIFADTNMKNRFLYGELTFAFADGGYKEVYAGHFEVNEPICDFSMQK